VGAKLTGIVIEAVGATVAGRFGALPPKAKAAPLTVSPLTEHAAVPVFCTCTDIEEERPVSTVPNASEAGEIVTAHTDAATPAPVKLTVTAASSGSVLPTIRVPVSAAAVAGEYTI
jgi:hypothetical protein